MTDHITPTGKLVDIGGRSMHLDCRGSGSPTVVFESGLNVYGSQSWTKVHDAIASTTRACTYDRAGMLWSDPSPHAGHRRRHRRGTSTGSAPGWRGPA